MFFNLWDENIILINDLIQLKERSCKYTKLANQTRERVKYIKINLAIKIDNGAKLRHLRNKYWLEVYEICEKTKILQEKLNNLVYNSGFFDFNNILDSNDKKNFLPYLYTSQSTPTTTN